MVFGYIGRFRNNKLGNYSMYVTDMNNLILVCTGNKKYVFSCSRPQEFVELLLAIKTVIRRFNCLCLLFYQKF